MNGQKKAANKWVDTKKMESSSGESASGDSGGSDGDTVVLKKPAKNASHIHVPVQGQPDATTGGCKLNNRQEDEVSDNRNTLPKENHRNTSTSFKISEFEDAWYEATDVPEYEGQLMPSGMLQSALTFSSAYTILRDQDLNDQARQVIEIFKPKLEELAKGRRFRTESLHCGAMSLIARTSSWDIHRQTFEKTSKVAVKIITDYEKPADIVKEVHTLLRLQHKGVVQLLGAFHDVKTHLVMPLFQGILRENISILSLAQKIEFTIQLLQAVSFIHDENILHLAISPANIFVTQQNNAVLGNFCSSQHLPEGVQSLRVGTSDPIIGRKSFNDAFANSRVYSTASDIFSLACTIYEMDTSEPLMEYETWDAPVEEYIKVALEGRLLKHPPSHGYNLGGTREPLRNRVRKSIFNVFLGHMVKHSFTKMGAAEILEKQESFFAELLRQNNIFLANIENDAEFGFVQLFPTHSQPPGPPNLSRQLNMALDNLYFDSNFKDASTEVSTVNAESTEFYGPVVPVNVLRKAIEELIQNSGKELHKTNKPQDVSQASKSSEQTISMNQVASKTSIIASANVQEKTETGRIKEKGKESIVGKPVPAVDTNKPSHVTQHKPLMPSLPKSPIAPIPTQPGKETAKPAATEPYPDFKPTNTSTPLKSETDLFQSSSTKATENQAGNQKSANTAQKGRTKGKNSAGKGDQTRTRRKPPAKRDIPTENESEPEGDSEVIPKKKRRSKSKSQNEKKEATDVEEEENGYTTDETKWVYHGNDGKPISERGRPAPYQHMPDEMKKEFDLDESVRGWIDCEKCELFYTVDYEDWETHFNQCKGRNLKLQKDADKCKK